jgi:hypothetical protein
MNGIKGQADGHAPRRLSTGKRAAYAGVSVLLAMVVCELALRGAAVSIPVVRYHLAPPWNRNVVNDPVFGYRMSPFYPEHDRRGYRNPDPTSRTDVIAIGDSTTYGFGVPPAEAWPAQLSQLGGRKVYNAGVGGYGPCEYGLVFDEILPDRPKIVVLVIYLGNDLIDAYRSVYVDGRCQELRSQDSPVLQSMRQADQAGTLQDAAEALGDRTVRGVSSEPGVRSLIRGTPCTTGHLGRVALQARRHVRIFSEPAVSLCDGQTSGIQDRFQGSAPLYSCRERGRSASG